MSTDLEKYLQLKRQAEAANQQADKAEGALEMELSRLQKEFHCDSIEQAEKRLRIKSRKRDKSKKKFERAIADFEKKWGEKLS